MASGIREETIGNSFVRFNTNCSCNFVPSLFLHFDVADIAGLVAPRPLVIQSAREDHLAGEKGSGECAGAHG